MQSKLIENNNPSELKFPLLAKNHENWVVLFTDYTEGVFIYSVSSVNKIGMYSRSWIGITNKDVWTILPSGSKIELIQE